MTQARSPEEILEREFLEIRAKILEIGASLDRLDRAEGSAADQERVDLIYKGIGLLTRNKSDRAESIQQLFSRQYNSQWRREFEI